MSLVKTNSQAITNDDLDSVTKIVDNFDNTKYKKQKGTSSNPADAKGDTDKTAQTNDDVSSGAKLQIVSETANDLSTFCSNALKVVLVRQNMLLDYIDGVERKS